MRTAQAYVHRQIYLAVLFVTIGFLALFFFFDALNEISFTSRNPVLQYTIVNALSYVAMLIPGNIPNIISAGKLGITSKEWAKLGVPLGLIAMLIYFVWIFYIPFGPLAG